MIEQSSPNVSAVCTALNQPGIPTSASKKVEWLAGIFITLTMDMNLTLTIKQVNVKLCCRLTRTWRQVVDQTIYLDPLCFKN